MEEEAVVEFEKTGENSYNMLISKKLKTLLRGCVSQKTDLKNIIRYGIQFNRYRIRSIYAKEFMPEKSDILFDKKLVDTGKKEISFATEVNMQQLQTYLNDNLQRIIDKIVVYTHGQTKI